MSKEIGFTSQSFLWDLYCRYTREYVLKCERTQGDLKYMMTPGLFCEYLSIRLINAVKKESKPFTIDTIWDVISKDLVVMNTQFSSHPAGPIGYMSIFEDEDQDHPPIIEWQNY